MVDESSGTTVLGIDPGIGGALALVGEESIGLYDMPTVERSVVRNRPIKKGKPPPVPKTHTVKVRSVNAALLTNWLLDWKPTHVYCEKSAPRPGEGVSSAYTAGRIMGTIEGVLAALGIPVTYVHPSVWKKAMGLNNKSKGDAINRALQLYPQVAPQLTRVKDHGRAEALLIYHYAHSKEPRA